MEFEIFKTGNHTSDKGIAKEYTEDDLNFIATSYNPSENEAPIVIGHPVDNAPAYGWIESLKVTGDKLIAKAKDVIPEFTEAVKKGLYKKRSISLDKDGKLRHVGFLGAAAPAVKGLADIQFSSVPDATYEYDIPGEKQEAISDNENNNESVSYPEQTEKLFSNFSDQLNNIQSLLSNLTQDFKEKDSEQIKNINQQINNIRFKLNTSELENKINTKLDEGSYTPAMKQKTMNLLSYINDQNFTDDFSFSNFSETIRGLINDFIDSVPKIIYYENFAEKPEDDIKNFTGDYSGLPVDEESSALHKKAVRLMKKDNISYESAVLKIVKKD
jgi:hypothetical protein